MTHTDAEALLEHAPCGYLSMLADGTIVHVNQTLLSWTGHDRDAVIGRLRLQDLLTPAGRVYHETHYTPLLHLQGAAREIALDLVCVDGRRQPVLINAALTPADEDSPPLIRATLFEASDRQAYERELRRARDREREAREQLAERNLQLERLAYTDPLTELDNRRALEAHLDRTIACTRRRGGGLAIALVDLDHFKLINDRFGHEAGDAVLRAAAGRMRAIVRREDMIGRWGGEEFLLIAPNTGADGIRALSERVRRIISERPVAHAGEAIAVTASIGWATWNRESPDALVAVADRALYSAKRAGRDTARGVAACGPTMTCP